ncbi:InlB B-repeat-containing protein, partial [Paenibacillus sp. NPDC056579]|uniref:InlB B-repeat-containing protein n=1 Tax=Paenibacillus sp. NPDC056579 TaxID=3345871 RepID=UPI003699309D
MISAARSFIRKSVIAMLLAVLVSYFIPVAGMAAGNVLNNGKVRFGDGNSSSVNANGNLLQPFYYGTVNGNANWYQLTYSTYPLDNALGVGGDGTSEWNKNGTIIENPALSNQVIDSTGYVSTGTNTGYGKLVSTGDVTIAGQKLQVKNTYTLGQNNSFVKTVTRITNISGAPVTNLRFWTGTRDDYVGISDSPKKERGNINNGQFVKLTNQADRAAALQISSGDTGVLFYSPSQKANVSIGSRPFTAAINLNPAAAQIELINDGAYALFIRMNDLADGQSEEFTWYYAAGELDSLSEVVEDVAEEAQPTTHTLTYTAGEHGTLTGSASQTVNHGADGTAVTAVPVEGYHFVKWSDEVTEATRTDLNVQGDVTVSAVFAINKYTLTYTAGENGTLDGSASQTVNHGADGTAVTAVPVEGYHFVKWSDDVTEATRTDLNVQGDVTVSAVFAINKYTLTYTA